MSLRFAHLGYGYQDLVTACCAVDLILGALVRIDVDVKMHDVDRFDDLTLTNRDGRRVRVQVKNSDEPAPIDVDLFVRDTRSLRLDTLVRSARADRDLDKASTDRTAYRLLLRDAATNDPALMAVLTEATQNAASLLDGSASRLFQFDADALWRGVHRAGAGRRKAGDAYEFLRVGADTRAMGSGTAKQQPKEKPPTPVTLDDLTWLCDRLVVETGAPGFSGSMRDPGPLEDLLLQRLAIEVGTGRYPNEDRSTADVATALVSLAYQARQDGTPLTRDRVVSETGLRLDFGAVEQRTPVDQSVRVDRVGVVGNIAEEIRRQAVAGGIVVVEAAPGQGKSWVSDQLQAALALENWVIAEHYCFLNDVEDERSERVLSERIWGSLLQRIALDTPEAVTQQRPLLAADEAALEGAVARLVDTHGRRVALVVDGLDHISRVHSAPPGAEDPSTALAAELAGLDLPAGAVLVVLAQPGSHLAPLRDAGAVILDVPSMHRTEITALMCRLGALETDPSNPTEAVPERSLASIAVPAHLRGLTSMDREALLSALYTASDGNPLYATYLCRELVANTEGPEAAVGLLRSLPAYGGSLENYYDHLALLLDPGGQAAADTLGIAPFALTPDELGEIEPLQQHRVPEALRVLQPVLRGSADGRLRIYHESFSRYLRQRLEANPAALSARRDVLAGWLDRLGYLDDRRAFGFLLAVWADGGRHRDVVAKVDREAALDALAAGFPASMIQANLTVGIRSACALRDWATVVRCVELERALATYQQERFSELEPDFFDVRATLLGPESSARQLLSEGRPTQPPDDGIRMCGVIDELGGEVPWREYLTAWHDEHEPDNETVYANRPEAAVQLAVLRGHCRVAAALLREGTATAPANATELPDAAPAEPAIAPTGDGGLSVLPERVEYLLGYAAQWCADSSDLDDHRAVVRMLTDTFGDWSPARLLAMTELAESQHAGLYMLAIAHEVSLGMVLAQGPGSEPATGSVDSCLSSAESAERWARAAVVAGLPSGHAHRVRRLSSSAALRVPESLGIGTAGQQTGEPGDEPADTTVMLVTLTVAVIEKHGVRNCGRWLDALVVLRNDDAALEAAATAIEGEGWYRCWLRFCVALHRAEAATAPARSALAIDALHLLTADCRPYAGDPRAVDLYDERQFIHESMSRAIHLLEASDWQQGIDLLLEVGGQVSASLNGAMGFPLPAEDLIALAMETAPEGDLSYARSLISREREYSGNRFYSDIARLHLMAARCEILAAGGSDGIPQTVRDEWREACRMMLAYGFRKDITVYEIIDPLEMLIEVDPLKSRDRLALTQDLAHRAWQHTDGSETSWAATRWWGLLASADPLAHAQMTGLFALAHMDAPRHLEERRVDILNAFASTADPAVVAVLAASVMDAAKTENLATAAERLHAAQGANRKGSRGAAHPAEVLLRLLVARADEIEIDGSNGWDRGAATRERLKQVASAASLAPPSSPVPSKGQSPLATPEMVASAGEGDEHVRVEVPGVPAPDTDGDGAGDPFPDVAEDASGVARLIRSWRSTRRGRDESGPGREVFARGIGQRFVVMVLRDQADACRAGLLALSQSLDISEDHRLLVEIAEVVAGRDYDSDGRRMQAQEVGAYALALAWCQARGGRGFLSFGGAEHLDLLERASALDADAARSAVADGIVQAVVGPSYRTLGITQALVYALAAGALIGEGGQADSFESASQVWDEAFAVIAARLPSVGDDGAPRAYAPTSQTAATAGEIELAIAMATFAGLAHPSRENKRRTLLALRCLAALRPDLYAVVLPHTLSSITNVLGRTWLLLEVRDVAESDASVLRHCEAALMALAATEHLVVRSLARSLLELHDPHADLGDPPIAALLWPTLRSFDEDDPPKPLRMARALLQDTASRRIQMADDVVAGLVDAVLEETAEIIDQGAYLETVRKALRALKSDDSPWPDAITPLHHGPEEALQRVAGAARAVVSARAEAITDPALWERELAEVLLPTPAPMMVELTRVPRPSVQPPPQPGDIVLGGSLTTGSLTTGSAIADRVGVTPQEMPVVNVPESAPVTGHFSHVIDAMSIICLGDAPLTSGDQPVGLNQPFAGWVVVAQCETRRIEGDRREEVKDQFIVQTAAAEIDLGQERRDHLLPPMGRSLGFEQWLVPLRLPYEDEAREHTPLACRADLDGSFRDDEHGMGLPSETLMVPSPFLIDLLDLQPSGELMLVDTVGPALTLVTWRCEYTYSDYHMPYARLQGAQLLLRPDLAQTLIAQFGARLTVRRHLVGPRVEA